MGIAAHMPNGGMYAPPSCHSPATSPVIPSAMTASSAPCPDALGITIPRQLGPAVAGILSRADNSLLAH